MNTLPAQERTRRRKSPWNLFLFPLAIFGSALSGWLLYLPIDFIRQWGMPENAFLSSGTRVGLVFLYVGLLLVSVAPGLLFANACAWTIPIMRKTLNLESAQHPCTDFNSSNRELLKFFLVCLLVFYPFALCGGLNFYSVTPEGMFYRRWFSTHVDRLDWQQLREVRTRCYSKRSAGEASFFMVFSDGTEVDIFSAGPRKFFSTYSVLTEVLKGRPFEFREVPSPTFFAGNPCPGGWSKYFSRRPGT